MERGKEGRNNEDSRRWKVEAISFARPFSSEPYKEVIEARTKKKALEKFVSSKRCPYGLCSVVVEEVKKKD